MLGAYPKQINAENLLPTVTWTFNALLGNLATDLIDIDHIHWITDSPNPSAMFPCDVICLVHFFKEKEAILNKAQEKGKIDSDGAQITLYQDVSKRTLAKRRALRLLTKALQEAELVNSVTERGSVPMEIGWKRSQSLPVC